jgi:CheY-like chemotaxis protein
MKIIDSPLANKNILIDDDDEDIRSAIIFDFKKRGCQIFEANSGRQALEIVKTQLIDIVLSDVRMPNGNGIDLVKEIRELNPHTPIILLATGFADLSEPEALALGAQALFEKPFDRKKIFQSIERLSF